MKKQYQQTKPWEGYPLGTKVYATTGGYWERTASGFKWRTGSTFSAPGGDWQYITEPEAQGDE